MQSKYVALSDPSTVNFLYILGPQLFQPLVEHLCFKQAQPKMCHSPKVDDGVDIFLKRLFSDHFLKKNIKLTSHLNRQRFLTYSKAENSADIHSQKAGTKFHTNWPYNSRWPRFFLNKPLLVTTGQVCFKLPKIHKQTILHQIFMPY